MPETFLMIVLTVMSGGQLSAAFTSAPTEAGCKKSAQVVGKILGDSGFEIKSIGCYRSSQSFSRYKPGTTDETQRQTFLLRMKGGTATVARQDTMAACNADLAAVDRTGDASAYCVTSTQTLVK